MSSKQVKFGAGTADFQTNKTNASSGQQRHGSKPNKQEDYEEDYEDDDFDRGSNPSPPKGKTDT